MALRIAFTPSIAAPPSSSSVGSQPCFPPFASKKDLGLRSCVVSSSIFHLRSRHDASTIARAVEQAASTCVGGVVEVTQETFWPAVEAAGDKLVVLDLYTQWCGPCKIMYPKIVDLSGKYTDVLFLKLDCNQDNKALAKKLGVKVVPTFKIFKNGQEIAEVKGAKFDEIVQNIDKARAS